MQAFFTQAQMPWFLEKEERIKSWMIKVNDHCFAVARMNSGVNGQSLHQLISAMGYDLKYMSSGEANVDCDEWLFLESGQMESLSIKAFHAYKTQSVVIHCFPEPGEILSSAELRADFWSYHVKILG